LNGRRCAKAALTRPDAASIALAAWRGTPDVPEFKPERHL
jgi:hypothetical protein